MKTLKMEAMELAESKLLAKILRKRTTDIIAAWQQSSDPEQREQLWHAQRQLTELAGAIDDGIREHGGSRPGEPETDD